MKSREEQLTWAKQRALICVDIGRFSVQKRHPKGWLILGPVVQKVRAPALEQAFAFAAPRDPGLDSVKSVKAMHDGRVKERRQMTVEIHAKLITLLGEVDEPKKQGGCAQI
jgi:hypothetical protein